MKTACVGNEAEVCVAFDTSEIVDVGNDAAELALILLSVGEMDDSLCKFLGSVEALSFSDAELYDEVGSVSSFSSSKAYSSGNSSRFSSFKVSRAVREAFFEAFFAFLGRDSMLAALLSVRFAMEE